jgi:hypothetical protein
MKIPSLPVMPRLVTAFSLACGLSGPACPAATPAESLTDALIAHWPFDEGLTTPGTSTASDVIGGAHGTLSAVDPASNWLASESSRIGGALRLDGETAFVTLPAAESLNPTTNQVSIALWVNLDSFPSDLPAGFGSIFDSTTDAYVLYLDRGNQELRFKVTDTTGQAARPGIPQDRLTPGEWMHVAAVYDGNASADAGEARIYLNGELIDTHLGADGAGGTGLKGIVLPGQIAGLSREGADARSFLGCALDDAALWRRALSAEEIAHLAAGNRVPTPPPPAAPLTIVSHPADATALAGSYVTFKVAVSNGIPPVSYQWRRNAADLPGATTAQLQVLASEATAGAYTAVASDSRGPVESTAARLTVTPLAGSPAESLAQGLVALWPLDDGLADPTSTNAIDRIHGNTGQLTNPDPTTAWMAVPDARFQGALHVDGATTSVTIAPSDSLNFTSDQVTVAAWVKLSALPSELPEAFGGIFDAVQDNFVLYLDRAAAELRFKVTDARGQAARPGIPEAQLVLGEWIHVAGVYDGRAAGTGGTATVYLNGQPADTHTGNDGSSGAGLTGFVRTGQSAAMGRNGTENRYFLDATLDDIAVWHRALSAAELAHLAAGNAVPLPSTDTPIRLLPPAMPRPGELTLSWTGGQAPYRVQRRSSLTDGTWEDLGPATDLTSANVATGPTPTSFFRVVGGAASAD